MTENHSNLISKLNPEQREAVLHQDGPMLIVAGAGTGKTTVLINRLAYLVLDKEINPASVLLLTFTDKAASEMTERADQVMPYGYTDLWIKTFHSFCETVLRDHGLEIGLNSDFRLITQTQQWILIKKNLALFQLDYYSPTGNPDKFVSELIRHFSRLKDENVSPKDYVRAVTEQATMAQDTDDTLSEKLNQSRLEELSRAYMVYNQLLLDKKLLDFGDLILYTLKLFQERPNILAQYHQRFQYIMVDEFQDTNWSQYELLKMLARPENNLMAVGDDDQAIYKFRGASIANIMQFKEDFPNAKQVVLRHNYRSAQIILDHAYELIKNNNPYRLEEKLQINKQLIARPEQLGIVQELVYGAESDELAGTAEMIRALHASSDDIAWSDIAILARSNDTAERFAKELNRHNIPSLFVSMKGLYHKSVVLDCLAYLKILESGHDAGSMIRVLDMRQFRIDQGDLIKINRYARNKPVSLFEALQTINDIADLSQQTIAQVAKLMALITKHYQVASDQIMSKLFIQVVHDVFLGHLDQDNNHQDIDYLNQLYQKILTAEKLESRLNISDLLELIEMELDAGDTGLMKFNWEDSDVVKVMTIHSAKGLEFDQVFVVNMVDKRFPSIGISDKIPLLDSLVKEALPEGDYHLQEERRLCYVAMTRAKSGLYLTRALDYGGATKKKPSVFIAQAKVTNQFNMENVQSTQLEKDLAVMGQAVQLNNRSLVSNKFSFSQLQAFETCPWQYRYAYILKVPTEDKPTAIFGRLMHSVLKDYFAPCLISATPDLFSSDTVVDLSLERLQAIFNNSWSDYGYGSQETVEKYKTKGQQMIESMARISNEQKAPKILQLENQFMFKLNDYYLKGAIDRIDQLDDGSVEIIDYKTGSPKDKLDFEIKKQLLLYQVAMGSAKGLTVSKLSYYYLESGDKLSFTAKEAELEKLKHWALETIEAIRRMEFTAKPGQLCKFCDFKNICEYRA